MQLKICVQLIKNIKRNGEKRLFITGNEPTCSVLIDNGFIKEGDIVFQKLTSFGVVCVGF